MIDKISGKVACCCLRRPHERNKPERMLQNVDDGSRNLAHMLKLMTELRSVMDERPDHALVEEVYATYDSLPAELRQMLDEKFQRMTA